MPSVDRVAADERDAPDWGPPRPWVAAVWVAVAAALLGAAAYLGLRADDWDLYQKDFGCTALTNLDSSFARSRCNPSAAGDHGRVPPRASNEQPIDRAEPLGLGGG